jgi:predicted RNase H-like HicB family nuclease
MATDMQTITQSAESEGASMNPADPSDSLVLSEKLEQYIQTVQHCPCCGEPVIFVPQLKCSHCDAELKLKCQVYASRGKYYAECLTLDLLSEGATKDEAIRRLQIAMFSYVETAIRQDKSIVGLIPRSAPLSSWIRYYANTFVDRVSFLFSGRIPLMIRPIHVPEADKMTVVHCQ